MGGPSPRPVKTISPSTAWRGRFLVRTRVGAAAAASGGGEDRLITQAAVTGCSAAAARSLTDVFFKDPFVVAIHAHVMEVAVIW